MIEPRRAATVVIGRDGERGVEIFLLRRTSTSAFMPDAFVFPGGRVEPGDDAPEIVCDAPDGARVADIVAAARETFEEGGVLFARPAVEAAARRAARRALHAGDRPFRALLATLGASVDGAALVPFSHWITPAGEPRRFDTRFFLAHMPPGQEADADERETHDGRWLTPAAALAPGGPALSFPTRKHLERLTAFTRWDDALSFARTKPIATVMPDADEADGFRIPLGLDGRW